jgi:hypothetical protein
MMLLLSDSARLLWLDFLRKVDAYFSLRDICARKVSWVSFCTLDVTLV